MTLRLCWEQPQQLASRKLYKRLLGRARGNSSRRKRRLLLYLWTIRHGILQFNLTPPKDQASTGCLRFSASQAGWQHRCPDKGPGWQHVHRFPRMPEEVTSLIVFLDTRPVNNTNRSVLGRQEWYLVLSMWKKKPSEFLASPYNHMAFSTWKGLLTEVLLFPIWGIKHMMGYQL